MKLEYAITIAFSIGAIVSTGYVLAQEPPLTYQEIVREVHRYEKLEGSERTTSDKVLFRKSRLFLKPVGAPSKGFFIVRKDGIGFLCEQVAPGFGGGMVEAKVVKHEEGTAGIHFFTLDNCSEAR